MSLKKRLNKIESSLNKQYKQDFDWSNWSNEELIELIDSVESGGEIPPHLKGKIAVK